MVSVQRFLNRYLPGVTAGMMAVSLLWSPAVWSGAGPLADVPVLLSNSVQPNVFFLADDSLSMDYQLLTPEPEGVITLDLERYLYTHPLPDNKVTGVGLNNVVPTEEQLILEEPGDPNVSAPYGGVWRAWNSDYNKIYYDPAVTYEPWPGVDIDGAAYADSDPVDSRLDPWDPVVGTLDLTQRYDYDTSYGLSPSLGTFTVVDFLPARYYVWIDTDGGGVVDATDGHTLIEILPANAPFPTGSSRTDCVVPTACTYTEELQNFANWFSYSRKRLSLEKRVLANAIIDSTARAGLGTLHNSNGVGTLLSNIDDITSPVDPAAAGNKLALLNNVFRLGSQGGTPLRQGFANVGEYFREGGDPLNLFTDNPGTASPILSAADGGACQQNIAILLADGFWNGSGAEPSPFNADGDDNTPYDGGSYADEINESLADLAMKYYEGDLHPGLADTVPATSNTVNRDNNPAQHLATYTVAFGISGELDANPPNATDPFDWPIPLSDRPTTVDDMRHAAWNGRGIFFQAPDPAALALAMETITNGITTSVSATVNDSFATLSLAGGSQLFRSGFDSTNWTGQLSAFDVSIDFSDVSGFGLNIVKLWDAHTLLAARDPGSNPRLLVTWDDDSLSATPAPQGRPFSQASLTAAQSSDLLTNYTGLAADSGDFIDRLIGWFGGDASNEVSTAGGTGEFRDRTRSGQRDVLGDIVNAQALFIGPPAAAYPDSLHPAAAYSSFKTLHANRTKLLAVAANDGGVHLFNATSGVEQAFYLPGLLFSTVPGKGMHALADPNYAHRFYTDQTPSVADVYVGGGTGWRTYVVGGFGGGGKGVYVLDVTNPGDFNPSSGGFSAASAAASLVRFEYTDADLGFTFSRPQIARMNNGEWAAVFGSGYNAVTGKAILYILNLSDFSVIKLETPAIAGLAPPADCSNGDADCNGLSTPTLVDLNADFSADRIYAGDLLGNLWVFDVSSSNTAVWQATTPVKLFTALDGIAAGANRQPITVQPSVALHPGQQQVTTAPNLLVSFGTGQLLSLADGSTTATQSFYTVWDRGCEGLTRQHLDQQLITTGTTAGGVVIRLIDDDGATVDYGVSGGDCAVVKTDANKDLGWFMDLPASAERVISASQAIGDLVLFGTTIPELTACTAGGKGWLMAVEQASGATPDFVTIDTNNNGIFDNDDTDNGAAPAGVFIDASMVDTLAIPVGDGYGNIALSGINGPLIRFQLPQPMGRTSWTTMDLQ